VSESSRTKNTILNFITGLGGKLLETGLNFISRSVFIYVLGKTYLGINGLFADILVMLSLTELGINTAIIVRLYRPLTEKDTKRVRLLMKFYGQAFTAIGSIILLLGLCVMPLLPYIIKDYDSLAELGINANFIFFLYLLQTVSSYLFFAYRTLIVTADQKNYKLSAFGYIFSFILCGTHIGVLLFTHNFVLYTVCDIAVKIIHNLVNAKIAKKLYPYAFEHETDTLDRKEIIDMFKDCGAIFIYKVNSVVLKATDNLVLSSFIGLSMVGTYSNYLMICRTIQVLLNRFYTSSSASVGNLYAVADTKTKYEFFKVMNYITVLFYGTACVGIASVANEFILNWIGSDYLIPQPFSVLIGIETLFVGLKTNLSQVQTNSGVFRQMWYRPVIGIIINLGVSVVLVRKYGICGVIIGTISADLFANFLVDPAVIHKYSFNNYMPVTDYYKKNILYLVILLAVGIVDYRLCLLILPNYGWLSVVIHTLICGISVPLVFLVLFWKSEEVNYLMRKVKCIRAD
jgi:O-antigen/teichoic acid export membrane protein